MTRMHRRGQEHRFSRAASPCGTLAAPRGAAVTDSVMYWVIIGALLMYIGCLLFVPPFPLVQLTHAALA